MSTQQSSRYLRSTDARAKLQRLDTGGILKRFFFCEEALIRGQAGWLAAIAPHEIKMLLPRCVWEDSLVANELRQRVFELRYPSRLMEIGSDAPIVSLFEQARHAPSAAAYLEALANVLIPALHDAYTAYLAVADDIGDGPTKRFLGVAMHEKARQFAELQPLVEAYVASTPALHAEAGAWHEAVRTRLAATGGLGLGPPKMVEHAPLAGAVPFALAQCPARDPRFHLGRYYWPDNVDAAYPYGDGVQLQLRSAVSHLNEVWAVENAGAILEAFAGPLGWEFVLDASRWLYDEARHTTMGWTRLRDWGITPDLLPIGSFLYESARDRDPIFRFGMLHFFETKNIGKKQKRAEAFGSYGDVASQHDMDFDWADEGIHAAFGKRWLLKLLQVRGEAPEAFDRLQQSCADLAAQAVAEPSQADIADIREAADRLIARAQALAQALPN